MYEDTRACKIVAQSVILSFETGEHFGPPPLRVPLRGPGTYRSRERRDERRVNEIKGAAAACYLRRV